jgi:hypothetical protein
LIAELRDRDRELNEMMAAHQHQLMAWEQDRQRLLTLEQRNAQTEGTLLYCHCARRQNLQQSNARVSEHACLRIHNHTHTYRVTSLTHFRPEINLIVACPETTD